MILHKVLVTAVQTTDAPKSDKSPDKPDDNQPAPAPKDDYLVTLAVDATSVQRVVFTAEFGKLWLDRKSVV